MKRILSVALCLMLVAALFTGCIPDSREFTCQDLTMEVPLLMKDVSSDSAFSKFTFALDSSKVAIFGSREAFGNVDVSDVTEMDYAKALIENNQHADFILQVGSRTITRSNEQYVYYSYEATVEGALYKYVSGVYKGSDAFWLVQFGGPAENFELETYLGYLDTVTVS